MAVKEEKVEFEGEVSEALSNGKYRVTAYVDNAFDDNYYTSTYDFGFSNGAGIVPSYRTYGVRFVANFGD